MSLRILFTRPYTHLPGPPLPGPIRKGSRDPKATDDLTPPLLGLHASQHTERVGSKIPFTSSFLASVPLIDPVLPSLGTCSLD